MEAATFLCVLLTAPAVAALVAWTMSRRDEARVRLLERKVDNLHARLQEVEAERKDPSPPVTPEVVEDREAGLGSVSDTLLPASDEVAPPELPPPPPLGEPTAPTEEEPASDMPSEDDEPEHMAARTPSFDLSPERVAVWIGATVGALALAVGGLFLVATAIEAGLLGPGVRVASAMAFGTLAWVGGAALRSRAPRASSGLSAAGAATVFGAIWASCDLYGLVEVVPAFTALLVVVSVTMLQAARFRDRFLANLALVGALLAAFVIDSTSTTLQLAYILLLNVAMVALVRWRSWPELLAVVGAGTGLQIVGLTATDLSPANQPLALFGIGLLMLPHLGTVSAPRDDVHRGTSLVVALGYLVLASPWAASLSEVFYDLRSGLSRVEEAGDPWLAAVGLLWLTVPAWLAARRTDHVAAALMTTLAALPVTTSFALGWSDGELLPLVVPPALGVVAHLLYVGRREAGTGLLPWFPWVILLTLGSGQDLGALPVVGMAWLSVAVVVGASFTSSRPYAPLALLPSLAIVGAWAGETYDAVVVGPALAACAVTFGPLVVRRWKDPLPMVPWMAALVAPVALLPGAYLWWREVVGVESIGVVPLLVALWALLLSVVLVRVHRVAVDSAVFSVGVLAVLFGVTVAIPMQLEERWLTVSWALQGALLAAFSRRLDHWLVRGSSVLLGVVVAVRLLINPWALAWGTAGGWPVLNWTLYTWGVPTVCLLVSAHFLARRDDDTWRIAAVVLRLLAMATGFAMLNVQVSHAFQDQGALSLYGTTTLQGMTRSIVWGGYGLFLLLTGIGARSRATRFLGFGFLMLAACKVFLWDVWSLGGLVRVGSLLGLGLFLIVSAFLFERLVLRRPDASDPSDDPEDRSAP